MYMAMASYLIVDVNGITFFTSVATFRFAKKEGA